MVSTGSKSHVKEKSLCDAPLSSPVSKFVWEGKGKVCEKLQQSRNDVKCDTRNPKRGTLLDNIAESEREHMVSTGSKSHVKEKSLCDAPLSSPVQKFVLEGKEVCEKLQQSRNDVKCDPGNPKHQDLLHKNISESEREHMVSTGSKSHVKEKSLCDAPLSSPLPKYVCEGKGEVCEKLQQSRNDVCFITIKVQCDPGNPKHQALLDKNISESEREHMVSIASVSHVSEKSLYDAPFSSPVSK
ncbi:uncharacterized protein LOC124975842, partial [Sciurus carolinensis]|uniref:uncharacterized protein LOC124975842 n=1 Tax=Sciurus carolinensis TaxID=30640 RepID=UPI001FB3E10B